MESKILDLLGQLMCDKRNAEKTKEELEDEKEQWRKAVSKSEIVYFKQ